MWRAEVGVQVLNEELHIQFSNEAHRDRVISMAQVEWVTRLHWHSMTNVILTWFTQLQ